MSSNKPVRVLQSVGIMNHGGIEHFLMNLYRRVDKDVVQFDFVERVDSPAVFDDEIRDLGGRIYRFASPDKHPIRAMRFYQKLFSEHSEYKVLHEHRASLLGFMGCLTAASRMHVPTRIVHAHSSGPVRSGLDRRAEIATDAVNKRRLKNLATDYFACSDAARRWMFPASSGVAEKALIIPNGIEAVQFRYCLSDRIGVRSELGIPHDAFVVGHVGRFDPVKNHAFLLDMLASFSREQRPYLLLVGDGGLRGAVHDKARSLNLDGSVIAVGLQDEVWRYYSAMDVLCMPSLHEGLPVSAIEAQASGLPLLLSDGIPADAALSGNVEFRSLVDGPSVWADAIMSLGEKTASLDRVQAGSCVAKSGFDIKETAERLQAFYAARSSHFPEGGKEL